MNLKTSLRIAAIGVLAVGFASLIRLPSSDESVVAPKTELQRLLAEKQFENALKTSNQLLRNNSQDSNALLAKGIALTALNQRTEAISLYQKMIKDFPHFAEPYNNLAALYAADGKYENARQTLEKAMQIHGSYAVAYKNLNAVYAKLADQAYNKALDVSTEKSLTNLQLSLLGEQSAPGSAPFTVAMSQFELPKAAEKLNDQKPVQLALANEQIPASVAPLVEKPSVSTSSEPATAPRVEHIQVAVVTKEPRKESKLQAVEKPVVVDKDITNAIQSWASAWSKQDIKAYLSHYASNFDPGSQSRSAWENDRRARIGGKARILVTVSDFAVSMKNPSTASVKFRQNYRSDRLNSQTSKTLVLERKADGWRIVSERAGS